MDADMVTGRTRKGYMHGGGDGEPHLGNHNWSGNSMPPPAPTVDGPDSKLLYAKDRKRLRLT